MSAQNPPRRGVFAAILGTVAFSVIAGILVAVMVTPALAVTSVVVKSGVGIFNNLPSYITIGTQSQQNRIFATQGGQPVQIATIFKQNREEVSWGDISSWVKDAAVDGEDRRFYQHGGIDPTGITRALLVGLTGGSQQGASTITQQLVKNILIQKALTITVTPQGTSQKAVAAAAKKQTDEQAAGVKAAQAVTLDRKLKEMKLAISLEKKYTKKQILLAYLNIVGFGGTTYGIQAAAERYYNTTAKDLTVAQAASLMAIVQQPTARAPLTPAGDAQNKIRRDSILGDMQSAGDITADQLKTALATPVDATTVTLTTPANGCIAANAYAKWFCDYVTKLVPTLTSLGATAKERQAAFDQGGYDIYTSLDLDLQTAAQNISWQYVPKSSPIVDIGEATTSVEVGTGRILTMAENKDFDDSAGAPATSSAVNYNTDEKYGGSAGFQGGSTYKAFTLIDWLQNGHGLNEVVNGSPRTVPLSSFTVCGQPDSGTPYTFHNDENEQGPRTVMSATARSINGAFISMAQQLDLCDIRKDAEAMGVHRADGTELQDNPSSVLGTNEVAPLTMAAAYAGIAADGLYCKPTAIDSITGPNGKKLPGQAKDCTQAIDPGVAAGAITALYGVLNGSGTGTASNPRDGSAVFGKTGTTNNSEQTWTVGASSRVATAVWVGNATGHVALRSISLNHTQAALLRHPLWANIMRAIDKEYPGAKSFPAPPASMLSGTGKPLQDVSGMSVAAATAILTGQGFDVTVAPGTVASAEPAGTVASTDPPAGSVLSPGYGITISTSDGSLAVTVPDAVGSGHNTYAQAVTILNNAGYMNVQQSCQTGLPANEGDVVSTNPNAGTVAPTSTTVTVGVVGKGGVCA
jgi:membrane peptidoglycan carboxypeptidase